MSGLDRVALERRLAALSPPQRALLLQQLAARGIVLDASTSEPGLDVMASTATPDPENNNTPFALTPSQRHVWLAQQLQPDASAYHIAFTWHLQGDLRIDAMQRALQAMVNRHGTLRTIFGHENGEPWQRQCNELSFVLTQSVKADCLAQQIDSILQKPFDPRQAPLLRAHLIAGVQGEHWLVLVWHHLIADGWSRGVFLRELAALYAQEVEPGQHPALSALDVGYAGYVQAQQRWLKSADCKRQTCYWQDKLAGVKPVELLPTRSSQTATDYRSATLSHTLSESLRQRVHHAARTLQVTPFVMLLTTFKLLLHRYTGFDDIAIGIPVAGRTMPQSISDAPDLSGLLGFFVNTLVIRSQPTQPDSIEAWLDSVKQALAEAFDHPDLPLANVIEAVNPPREAGRTPLFDLMFQYQNTAYRQQNASNVDAEFPGLKVEQQWHAPAHTKFDMSWHAVERDNGLLLAVEYRSALFSEAWIAAMLAHFSRLLDGLANTITRNGSLKQDRVSCLPMLSDDELTTLKHWQAPASSGMSSNSVHTLVSRFEISAAEFPGDIAVSTPDGHSLNYRELNQRANQLASYLCELGIQNEQRVGIWLPREPALLVAILGVLKCGAAYVPLDPALPADRLRYIAQDAGLRWVVGNRAENSLGDWLPTGCTLISPFVNSGSESNLSFNLHPDQIAYTIYTSGSSGKPKGTLLTHGGLMHYLDWCLARYPLQEGCGALVNSSIGFDATITGLFAPLLMGRTVMLIDDDKPLQALAEAMEQDYSLVKLTPAHLSALQPLLQAKPPRSPQLMPRAFIIGGEALTEAHIRFWREHYPHIQLINEYGPTETVVGCAYYRAGDCEQGPVPIGTPIAGASLYVLDENLNPVPVGVPGELYIGGRGMARGYLNRPDLTAERFLPDPFSAASGAVMYRSGDLAYWRADGELLYLGRADQQIKLRGYRIEPGEVESALCRLDLVEDAIVMVRTDHGMAPRLVAYLRFHTTPENIDDWYGQVRGELANWLPGYMMPSVCIALTEFPLTANGKVDRAALPAPTISGQPDTEEDDADWTPQEKWLRDCWRQVLKRQTINRHSNFFELGGDSVSAMQIVAAAHRHGFSLSARDIFEYSTLSALTQHLKPLQPDTFQRATGISKLSPIQHHFFLRVGQGHEPNPHHHNQSLLLAVQPGLNIDWLYQALQHMAQQHDALRLRFSINADATESWQAQYSDENIFIPLEEVNASGWDTVRFHHWLTDQQGQLNIEHGPMMRGYLITRSGESPLLLLVAHHLIVDGVSWRLLLQDLVLNYQQLESGADMPPARPALPFAHWTRHLQESLPLFLSQWDYWVHACQTTSPWPLEVAICAERTATEIHQCIDGPLAISLNGNVAARLNAAVDEILLTALSQTLCAWLGVHHLTLDVESHGRHSLLSDSPDVSRTTGWFTALYPLRITMAQAAPTQQLATVQECWRSVPHHGVGYGVLRQADALSVSSPAQVSFNYLGQVDLPAAGFISGLAVESMPAQRHPEASLPYPLQVVALMRDHQLRVVWRYAPEQLSSDIVHGLTKQFRRNLETLLALDAQISAQASTPSNVVTKPDASRIPTTQAAQALLAKLKRTPHTGSL